MRRYFNCEAGSANGPAYEATGKLGGQWGKGTVTIVGGTGKCGGIQGSGEFDRLPGFRPAAKGTFQGINKSKLNWKIP